MSKWCCVDCQFFLRNLLGKSIALVAGLTATAAWLAHLQLHLQQSVTEDLNNFSHQDGVGMISVQCD